MRIAALIPARAGSKGLPGKNIKPLAGKPLIHWTLDAALASSQISETIVSTDDNGIAELARQAGVMAPFLRPAALSTDTASTVDVVLHALDYLHDYDYLVLLQPTSPLRTTDDIDSAIRLMVSKSVTSCVSLCTASKHPNWMYNIDDRDMLVSVTNSEPNSQETGNRRQDQMPVYVLNGAIYVTEIAGFKNHRTFIRHDTVGYVMPVERSVDIDTSLDFQIAELLIKNNRAADG